MKIEYHLIESMSLEEFADKYNLTMVIHEREYKNLPRFYAEFKNVDLKDDSVLRSCYGDGETPEEAMRNHAKEISGKLIVIGAYAGLNDGRLNSSKVRREIRVPKLNIDE